MKKIILDDIHGERQNFVVTEDGKLYCECEGKERYLLSDGITPVFDATVDALGHVHLAAVTADGEIMYFKYDFSSWKKFTVMSDRSGNARIKSLRIICISGRMNLWYSFEYDDKKLLTHQIFDGPDMIGSPEVVDELGYRGSFSVCCDNDLNTHIFYADGNETSRYRVFSWSRKAYEELPFEHENIGAISSICDAHGVVRVAFVARSHGYYVVCCAVPGAEPRTVGFGVGAGCVPNIIAVGDTVYVQWSDNFETSECVSYDGGKNFSPPKTADALPGGAESFGAYRRGKDGLCIGLCRALMSRINGGIIHETEILEQIEDVDEKESEIMDYYNKSGDNMQVSIDLAARLGNIEQELETIARILSERFGAEKAENGENGENGENLCDRDIGEVDADNLEIFENMNIEP